MGTLTFLRNILGIPKPKVPGVTPLPPNRHAPRVEIFGPRGIRRMLRMLWHMTHTHSEHPYVVNELLFPGEQPSIAANVSDEPGTDETDVRRESECIGRDIWCDENGFWRSIVDIPPDNRHHLWGAIVDAGPIQHRGAFQSASWCGAADDHICQIPALAMSSVKSLEDPPSLATPPFRAS